VFIEDLRRDGKFMRCSWHGDRGAFVISTWEGDVCVGAVQLKPRDAARLTVALAEGLADAAESPAHSPAPSPAVSTTWRDRLHVAVARLTRRGRVAAWDEDQLLTTPSPVRWADDPVERSAS
jgi:hypothetical protein